MLIAKILKPSYPSARKNGHYTTAIPSAYLPPPSPVQAHYRQYRTRVTQAEPHPTTSHSSVADEKSKHQALGISCWHPSSRRPELEPRPAGPAPAPTRLARAYHVGITTMYVCKVPALRGRANSMGIEGESDGQPYAQSPMLHSVAARNGCRRRLNAGRLRTGGVLMDVR